MQDYCIGIDIGGTMIKGALFGSDGAWYRSAPWRPGLIKAEKLSCKT